MALAGAPAPGDWPRQRSPVLDWLVSDARRMPDGAALLTGLCEHLVETGLPLARGSFHLRLLHPQLFGTSFYWQRGAGEIRVFRAERGLERTDTYLSSPMRVLFEGAGAVRQRLDLPGAEFPFRLLYELRDAGLTDYVALPITFSDGKIHGTTWSSDRPGGFLSEHLEAIQDLLPVVSLLLEIRLDRLIAITLLDTYVGHDAGARILEGQIARGSGATLQAAVWFCDLIGFSAMSEHLARNELLDRLNQFFDGMAGAVEHHGGQILKFIGDAMLAVFPLEDERACLRALQAAIEARGRMAALNATRAERGETPLDYGIALHAGEVMYGNIGAAHRLDFTVTGPAVNVASRIERLCRTLGPKILVSDAFACGCGQMPFHSLGRHRLDGIEQEMELLTLPEAA